MGRPHGTRRFQQVPRPHEVRLEVGFGMIEAVPHPRLRREVDDCRRRGIGDTAGEQLPSSSMPRIELKVGRVRSRSRRRCFSPRRNRR